MRERIWHYYDVFQGVEINIMYNSDDSTAQKLFTLFVSWGMKPGTIRKSNAPGYAWEKEWGQIRIDPDRNGEAAARSLLNNVPELSNFKKMILEGPHKGKWVMIPLR
jgi:hypothetical protein